MARLHASANRIPKPGRVARNAAIVAAGAIAGLLIGVAVINTIREIDNQAPGGIPVSDPAPDYAATIRAPAPTPEPGALLQSRDTPITEADAVNLAAYMAANARRHAISIAVQDDEADLMRLIAGSPATEDCHRQIGERTLELAQRDGLLNSTAEISEAGGECLSDALAEIPPGHYGNTSTERREEKIAEFLLNHAVATNPTTEAVADTPSPENMQFWRTAQQWHQACYETAQAKAESIAQENAPALAAELLEQTVGETDICMSETERQLRRNIAGAG